MVQTATTLDVLRKKVAKLRESGETIALVPTMGALHDGHLTLVRRARDACDHVVASIFVNPTQFGPNEDLDAYPRQLDADAEMLESAGCALLWAPTPEEMYPDGPENFVTNVSVRGVSEGFCGASRPGHFDGVATVVCKLFNQVRPDMAFFGEKDFQQLAVIRAMARDLDLSWPQAHSIIGVPTVREADGLAMSSRNRYLSRADREAAAILPSTLARAAKLIGEGEQEIWLAKSVIADDLQLSGFEVDYIEVVDSQTLKPLETLEGRPARILVAARIGKTRLIDNMAVG
nr:pantoate--beta-alanine ligase [Erythrobacter sp. F6033]